MTDIKSTVLKNILSKKLNKAKEGMTQILKDKSFKAIEDLKSTFKYTLPTKDAPAPEAAPVPEPTEADK
tara:strand:- start:392 stop:598 length:207 start_codon:yes stop_codon:yes gene_type:complete